jgi:hypothetical protein
MRFGIQDARLTHATRWDAWQSIEDAVLRLRSVLIWVTDAFAWPLPAGIARNGRPHGLPKTATIQRYRDWICHLCKFDSGFQMRLPLSPMKTECCYAKPSAASRKTIFEYLLKDALSSTNLAKQKHQGSISV